MMASIDGAVNQEYGCVLDEYEFELEAERGARPKTFRKSEGGSTTNSGHAPARQGVAVPSPGTAGMSLTIANAILVRGTNMVGDMSFREGDVGSNPARIETEMSPKDQWPRDDSRDGHQLELLLKALEMENPSHHDPPQPLTSILDGPRSRSPGAGARHISILHSRLIDNVEHV